MLTFENHNYLNVSSLFAEGTTLFTKLYLNEQLKTQLYAYFMFLHFSYFFHEILF